MSGENKNIDQLFSDAAQNQKAPQYNPAYWEEMDAFLNARAAKKRTLILWTSIGSALCVFLLSTLFIINADQDTTRAKYAQAKLELNSTSIAPLFKTPQTSFQHKADESESISNNTLANRNRNTNSVQDRPSKTANTTAQNFSKQGQKGLNDIKQNSVSQSNASQSTSDTYPVSNFSTTNIESGISNKRNDKNFNAINKNPTIAENKAADEVDKTSLEEIETTLPLKGVNLLPQNVQRDLVKVKHKSKIPLSLYARIGGGLMENYKTGSPYQSGLIDLSLNLEARFNSILLRAGVGTQYTTHADLVVSQRAKIYGFGVRNQQNDLAYQDLLDIYVPLELGYQLKSTSFGIGVQANYLLTTSMNFNTYQDQVLTNSQKYYGNKNGLRSFSSQGYVWLEQRVLPRFSVGLKIGTNISGRIKDEKYFNRSATINPIYGQLIFRINIL